MTDPRIRRMRAAQACVGRFRGHPYDPGKRDCPLLALYALRRLHVPVSFAKGLRWASEAEGLRRLKTLGFTSLIDAMDSLGLPRIAPATARAADIIALPTQHQLGALSVSVGNGSVLAFTELSPDCEVIRPLAFVTDALGPCAWRVIDG